MTTAIQPYAKCTDCDLEFPDRDAASLHSRETTAPVSGQGGITARGHSYTVVNPTPEEVQASKVRYAIERALDDLYQELDQDVQRGDSPRKRSRIRCAGSTSPTAGTSTSSRRGTDG